MILLQLFLPTGNLCWGPQLWKRESTGSDKTTCFLPLSQQNSERDLSQRACKATSASLAREMGTSITGFPRWRTGKKGTSPPKETVMLLGRGNHVLTNQKKQLMPTMSPTFTLTAELCIWWYSPGNKDYKLRPCVLDVKGQRDIVLMANSAHSANQSRLLPKKAS